MSNLSKIILFPSKIDRLKEQSNKLEEVLAPLRYKINNEVPVTIDELDLWIVTENKKNAIDEEITLKTTEK